MGKELRVLIGGEHNSAAKITVGDMRAAHAALSKPCALPAEGKRESEAAKIGYAVLDWMVKYDLLDGDREYYVADVVSVLDELTLASPTPSERQGKGGEG